MARRLAAARKASGRKPQRRAISGQAGSSLGRLFRAGGWATDIQQQLQGFGRLQDVQVLPKQAGKLDRLSGGDKKATGLGRNQLENLLIVKGVIEKEQNALASQQAEVHIPDFLFIVRNPFIGMISMDDRTHCLRRLEGIVTSAPHVHDDLAIRIAIFERLGQLECKGGLADAADAPQAMMFVPLANFACSS